TEVNALVIGVKDDRGFVLYRSHVALAHEIGADTVHPLSAARTRALLDTMQPVVWQYAVDLAREAVDLGFSEIQLDYVRFPDDKRLVAEATFPLAQGRTRAQVIRDQLGFVRRTLAPLGVPVTADVFGLTASDTTDMGIGQRWEMFVDQLDVV